MGDPPTAVLVVGVGSELRRDDAVGRIVAERIEEHGYPGVSVESVTQLLPELVEMMVTVDRVVIVDAAVDAGRVVVQRVEPRPGRVDSHHGDPAALLGLAATIGGPGPETYVVRVPAFDLGLGTGLTSACETAAAVAVDVVARLLTAPPTDR